jgi:hypothetical protein
MKAEGAAVSFKKINQRTMNCPKCGSKLREQDLFPNDGYICYDCDTVNYGKQERAK